MDCHDDHSGHGMNKKEGNHDKHAGHSPEMFRQKFWLSLVFTISVLLYSEPIQNWFSFRMPAFPGSEFVPLVFSTILFFYSGTVFIRSAIAELKNRQPGMMTLISEAILIGYVYSLDSVVSGRNADFFWELSTLITIMIFGHWMEMRSVANATGALNELAKLLPDQAELAKGGMIPVASLKIGDIVLVRPGSKVPADGMVVSGSSQVNESMITGESALIPKASGSRVIAGTVNGVGSLTLRVEKIGESTALAGIMRLLREAQMSKSKTQILADRAAFYLTIIATISGLATLFAWLGSDRGMNFAFERAVTVFIIACPHALGLAVPLVTSISTSLAARNGLLVRQRLALESARNINVVLFDKTGTLTRGEHGIVDVWPDGNTSLDDLIRFAATAEKESEHAIGKAIVDFAKSKNINLSKSEKFAAIPGHGVEAIVEGRRIQVGGPQLIKKIGALVPDLLKAHIDESNQQGKTVIYVLSEGKIIGVLTSADLIRPESKPAVADLLKAGIRVAMLTGDSQGVADFVAKELGIKEVFAQVLPEHKVDKVKALQQDGSKVAMVGDGVNDAPALAQADIGIAIGAGTDVAIESAGIILAKSDPRDIIKIIKLSKATYRKMQQNLVWASGYNLVAIPLAAGLFGIFLPAAVGALLMSLSTIIVALNAQLLRRIKLA